MMPIASGVIQNALCVQSMGQGDIISLRVPQRQRPQRPGTNTNRLQELDNAWCRAPATQARRYYAAISVATSSSADTIGSQAPSADLLPWSVHIVPAPIPWADFSPLRLRVVHFATKSRFRSEERRVGKECRCRWAAY